MSKCQDLEPLLAAYVDGEAPPSERASVAAHLDRCPPCRDRVAGEQAAHDALKAHRDRLRPCASEALKARCAGCRAASSLGGLLTRRTWVPLSLAATLVLAVAGVFLLGGGGVEALAAQLTLDHVKCFKLPSESPAPDAKAAATDWAARQGWEIQVPASSEAEQLQLICVRRCFISEGRTAHMMYTWRGQPLSVFVLPSAVANASENREVVERFGHEAIVWSGRGRTYVVLARGRPADLEGVVGYVKASVR